MWIVSVAINKDKIIFEPIFAHFADGENINKNKDKMVVRYPLACI